MLTFEKEVISILSSFYLIGQPRDPIERIWTFVCPFYWGGGEEGGLGGGAIYLIIPNQQSSNTSPALIVRKEKRAK